MRYSTTGPWVFDVPSSAWPALPVAEWQPTRDTLQLWTQVVGKVRLANTPLVNHWWNTTLCVTARGLSTSLIPYGDGRGFEMEFDFASQVLRISVTDGSELQLDRVFHEFRGLFIGKVSPVHFFWGGFDLAVTRFSGRRAPRYTRPAPNCGPQVMEEAYSHEVSSAGYWPGLGSEGVLYSYAYPEPEGFRDWPVSPTGASYNDEWGEFVLPYEVVRTSPNPDTTVLQFLNSTYDAAAECAKWDRAQLERAT